MKRCNIQIVLLILTISSASALSQPREKPLQIFGYFQNQFKDEGSSGSGERSNTFLLQQLNVFMQKNFSLSWSAFVNIEMINTYSSGRSTGAMNLEEAWVKYRLNRRFNLRLGLQIPTFNHLNRIKNRTPLLPYIIRPVIYETSLSEVVPVEEFTPARAFLEVYGSFPARRTKLDYAFHLGNSPNITTLQQPGQSGVDTTRTFAFGGRLGIRRRDFRIGFSATYDKVNIFQRLAERFELNLAAFREIPRVRLGTDVSFTIGSVFFDAEYVHIDYREKFDQVDFDKDFFYATLGWRVSTHFSVYFNYWKVGIRENEMPAGSDQPPGIRAGIVRFLSNIESPNFGMVYHLTDKIVLKGQITRIGNTVDNPVFRSFDDFDNYSLAISVFF